MIQLQGIDKRPLQLTLFVFGKSRDEVGELTLEHQRQKIAPDRAILRQAVLQSDQDLALEPERLAIDRRLASWLRLFLHERRGLSPNAPAMTSKHVPLTLLLGGALDARQVLGDRGSNDLRSVGCPAAIARQPIDAREHSFVNSDRNSLHVGTITSWIAWNGPRPSRRDPSRLTRPRLPARTARDFGDQRPIASPTVPDRPAHHLPVR